MQESSLFIILTLSVFLSVVVSIYSVYLGIKTRRKTFYFSIFVSLCFLLFSVFVLISTLENEAIRTEVKYIPLLLFLIVLWGLTLSLFYKDLHKKAGNESIKKMQKIDKNEKEYLSKILRKHDKKGKSAKKAIGKMENSITDPIFLEISHPIFIVGMKSTGKTTIGSIVASKLNVNFIDTDELLLSKISVKYGTLKHFYRTKGKEAYLETEALTLYNYLKEHKEGSVIALGGGCAENPFLIKMVRSAGYIIYLKMIKETLYKRIIDEGITPAFVNEKNVEQSFEKTYDERIKVYEEIKDLTIEVDDKASPYENAYKVLSSLEDYFSDTANVRKITDTVMPTNIIRLSLYGNNE